MSRRPRIEHCDSCGVEIVDAERRDCPACSNDTKCVECAPDGKPCLPCQRDANATKGTS